MSTNKLFAYGILKERGNVLYRNVRINADMYDLGGFPAITNLYTYDSALGNVLEVTEEELDNYDRIEGVDLEHPLEGLYRRDAIFIPEINEEVWIYVYNQIISHLEKINVWERHGSATISSSNAKISKLRSEIQDLCITHSVRYTISSDYIMLQAPKGMLLPFSPSRRLYQARLVTIEDHKKVIKKLDLCSYLIATEKRREM